MKKLIVHWPNLPDVSRVLYVKSQVLFINMACYRGCNLYVIKWDK